MKNRRKECGGEKNLKGPSGGGRDTPISRGGPEPTTTTQEGQKPPLWDRRHDGGEEKEKVRRNRKSQTKQGTSGTPTTNIGREKVPLGAKSTPLWCLRNKKM